MKNLRSICLVAALLDYQPMHAQELSLTISFDGPPTIPPGSGYSATNYFESGMKFVPSGPAVPGNTFGRIASGHAPFADNGTVYINTAAGEAVECSFVNSSLFGVVSVDLAEYSTAVPDPVTIQFIGYRPDGSTVTQSFTTDGIIDGTGPISDFQTFLFAPEFTGLERVEIPTFDWSLDNLVVIVPEPSSASLLLLGALCFWQARRTRRQRI